MNYQLSINHFKSVIEFSQNSISELAEPALMKLAGFIECLYLNDMILESEFEELLTEINQVKIEKGILLQYELDKANEYARVAARVSN